MSIYGEKLKNILVNGGYPLQDAETVVSYAISMGRELFYPRSAAMKIGLPIETVIEMFSFLLAKGALSHFSIPRYNGKVLSEKAVEGFQLKFLDLQDPDDFYPIDSNDVEIISGFKLKDL